MSTKPSITDRHMMDMKVYNFQRFSLDTMDPNNENNKKISMFDCGDKIIAKLIQEIDSIMRCEFDKYTKIEYILKLSNSYVSFFANMSGMVSCIFRGPYCEKISWSIISNVDELLQIKNFLGPNIVDLMCGQGYISYLLSLIDCSLQPIDNFSGHGVTDNSFKFYKNIKKLNISNLVPEYYSFIASWPPYECRKLTNFLKKLKKLNIGFKIVYIGEGSGGCTGSDCLHELFDSLIRVKEIDNKTWNSIYDSIVFYEWETVNDDSIVNLFSSARKYLSVKKISRQLSIKKSFALSILRNSDKFVSFGLNVVGSIKKGTVWALRT